MIRFLACLLAALTTAAQTDQAERARALLAAGRSAEAAAIYRDIVRAHPGNPDLLVNLSIAQYKAGQFREAAESAGAAVKLAPDLAAGHLFLGAARLERGEFGKAAEALDRAVTLNPQERNGRLMLAEALRAEGRNQAALTHFRLAAQMLPANPRVWYGLGKASESQGLQDEARQAWQKLEALPPSLESHIHSAEEHDQAQRWRAAAAEWNEAVKLAPGNRKAVAGLAWSLFRSRDYDHALQTLAPLENGSAEILFLRGASLINLQRPAEAMPYLEAALVKQPDLLPARAALGQALLQTGRAEQAVPYLKSALAADTDGTVHFQLFRACQLTGRKADAQQALAAWQKIRASASPVTDGPAPQ